MWSARQAPTKTRENPPQSVRSRRAAPAVGPAAHRRISVLAVLHEVVVNRAARKQRGAFVRVTPAKVGAGRASPGNRPDFQSSAALAPSKSRAKVGGRFRRTGDASLEGSHNPAPASAAARRPAPFPTASVAQAGEARSSFRFRSSWSGTTRSSGRSFGAGWGGERPPRCRRGPHNRRSGPAVGRRTTFGTISCAIQLVMMAVAKARLRIVARKLMADV